MYIKEDRAAQENFSNHVMRAFRKHAVALKPDQVLLVALQSTYGRWDLSTPFVSNGEESQAAYHRVEQSARNMAKLLPGEPPKLDMYYIISIMSEGEYRELSDQPTLENHCDHDKRLTQIVARLKFLETQSTAS